MRHQLISVTFAAVLGLAGAVNASEVEERIQGGALAFSGGQTYTNAVLTITGPNGFEAEKTATRGLPIFRIQGGGGMVDGYYQYALVAASDKKIPVNSSLDNGRGANSPTTQQEPFSMYGAFQVARGLIVPVEAGEGGPDGDPAESK